MPNNTITDSHSPEGHAFCVCSVLAVDKMVGNSWYMQEFRDTADCLWQLSPVLNSASSERQAPQHIKTLRAFCGSKSLKRLLKQKMKQVSVSILLSNPSLHM